MRKTLFTLILSAAVFCNLPYAHSSESRVNQIILEDTDARLDNILKLSTEIRKSKIALNNLSIQLSQEEKKESRRKLGITIASVSAVIVSFSVLRGLNNNSAIGSSMYFMQSIVVTATGGTAGATLIFLNKNESEKLKQDIKNLNVLIDHNLSKIAKETLQLCKIQPQHKICY